MEAAVIGGTGVYDLSPGSRTETVNTRYGAVQVDIVKVGVKEVAFLARHGKSHSVPPHLINYRANMKALKELGVKYIYASAAVGSCNCRFAPGDIVVITDFIDFTKARLATFYDGGEEGVAHVDMSDPYCKNLRKRFYDAANREGLNIKGDAVYVCTEGPRFETAHEIKMYRQLGGDVVGMTSVPEAVLAKELGMCYAAVGIITNWCTGIDSEGVKLHDIKGLMAKTGEKLTRVFVKVLTGDLSQENCSCAGALVKM
ncbi:MAG: S-methyl-5'-thioinosine phosphorylase [Tepidanaerobacteraceae bacterium]|jgi:5'-methylthioadenosine phosphorylase|nr:S-methyl-5'-thioinosine phosphorylase [Tepidanaerobacteraceae bacterium]